MKKTSAFSVKAALLVYSTFLIAWTNPAYGASCQMSVIEGRSTKETAAYIMSNAERVGIGVIKNNNTRDTKSQKVDILVSFKGAIGALPISPYLVNHVSLHDDLIRMFPYKEHELHLFALVRDRYGLGYVTPVCLMANLNSKNVSELITALIAQKN